MKLFTKKIVVLAIVLLISLCSVTSVFAAENLEINGEKGIKKGDIVTYTLNLSDCTEGIVGLQMYIFYDRQYLDIEDNSFETPQLNGAVANTQGDYIVFTWTDVMNLADFSKKKVMASVDFKVIKGGKTDITYFVSDMYGEDMTYLKSYTFTYDLSVNEKVVIDDEVPTLTDSKEYQDRFQGMFVNYVDGKGEVNGATTGKDDKGNGNVVSGENGKGEGKVNTQRETVRGETQAPATFETGEVIDGSSFDLSEKIVPILIICVVILLIGAIVVLAIINNARKRKEE